MTSGSSENLTMQGPVCPLPHQHTETVVIGHGSGGVMTRDLIQHSFFSRLGNAFLCPHIRFAENKCHLIKDQVTNTIFHMAEGTDEPLLILGNRL